jgi:hypothetical protein
MAHDFMGYVADLKRHRKTVDENFPELDVEQRLAVALKFFEAENNHDAQHYLASELSIAAIELLTRAGVPLKPPSRYVDD